MVQCCDLEQRRVVPPLHEGHTELNNNRLDWLDSREDNLSVSSTYQLDLAAELRIDGCGRGFNPQSCPLGEDTITILHSHSSANAPPFSPPHRVPLITGSPSLCQRACI